MAVSRSSHDHDVDIVDPQFGLCSQVLAETIHRRIARIARLREADADVLAERAPDLLDVECIEGLSRAMSNLNLDTRPHYRIGSHRAARFRPNPDFLYVGRDDRERGLGPNMYLVASRILIAYSSVAGNNHTETVELLRCQQAEHSNCEFFGYLYKRVIFTYGFHNHA